MSEQLTIGGLFEGYGGLAMAVRRVLGGELAWYSEIESAAIRVLDHHHPNVPNLGDVTAVDWSTVPRVNVLTGGFPCTDVSSAGKREGLRRDVVIPAGTMSCGCRWASHEVDTCAQASGGYVPSRLWTEGEYYAALLAILVLNLSDLVHGDYPPERVIKGTRSGLWSHMATAIDVLRPDLVVIENVRGILSTAADGVLEPCPWCVGDDESVPLRALGCVLGDLADIGFDAEWVGLRASDVGAPHPRFRVVVLAWPNAGNARGVNRDRWGAAELAGQAGPEAGPAADAAGDGWNARRTESAGFIGRPSPALGGGEVATDPDGSNAREQPERLAERDGRAVAGRSGEVPDWGAYEPAIRRWERILGRSAPAPTQPGKRGGPQLSPLFVEWLMGLATGHVTAVPGVTRSEALKLLGNGVVPRQIESGVRHLLPVMLGEVPA